MKVDCQTNAYPVSVCSAGLGGSVVFFETAGKEVKVAFIYSHATIAINKLRDYYK